MSDTPLRRIVERHRDRGLTQKGIADALGVSEQTVWAWCKGSTPGGSNLVRLAEYLRAWEPKLQPADLLEAA